MRLPRRWVWTIGALIAVVVVLQGVRVWLEATGRVVSIRVGRPHVAEHVDTNFPIRIDVLREVYPIADVANSDGCVYAGMTTYTFTNHFHDEILIRLPLLRMAHASPNLATYLDHKQLPPELKVPQTIVLKRGVPLSITVPTTGDTSKPLRDLVVDPPEERAALVFGCPDGEDPDRYVVGTILSNPIRWKEVPKPPRPQTTPATQP